MTWKKTVERGFAENLLDALAAYQALEALLRDCIRKSDPDPKVLKRLDKMGLGGLAEEFQRKTAHTELCDRICDAAKDRNDIAHRDAIQYLTKQFNGDTDYMNARGVKLGEKARIASGLYFELLAIYKELL